MNCFHRIHFNSTKYQPGYMLSVTDQINSFTSENFGSAQFRQNFAIFVNQTLKKQNFIDFINQNTIHNLITIALSNQILLPFLSFLSANSDILGEILAFSGGFLICQKWKGHDAIEFAVNMLASSEATFRALPDNFLADLNSTKISYLCLKHNVNIQQSINYIEPWRDEFALLGMQICVENGFEIRLPPFNELIQILTPEALKLLQLGKIPIKPLNLTQKFTSAPQPTQREILILCAIFPEITIDQPVLLEISCQNRSLGPLAVDVLCKNPTKLQPNYVKKLDQIYSNCGAKCLDLIIELVISELVGKDEILTILAKMVEDEVEGSSEVLAAVSEI